MPDPGAAPGEGATRPILFTIPTHRSFADALAAGLIADHRGDLLALARGRVLLPNNRAVRTLTEAFVRLSDSGGLVLPRLIAIGDPELDDRIGGALDPAVADDPIPPAVEALPRLLALARLVRQGQPEIGAAEAMRLATELARTRDALLIEEVDPARLTDAVADAPDLAVHWQVSLDRLRALLDAWPRALAEAGRIDLADRRNRLLRATAQRWADHPPSGFTVAAGITSAAPAIAALLARVAAMPGGIVVLPGLALADTMDDAQWDALGPDEDGRHGDETHPQFHLKRLLDRMGFARAEVRPWRRAGRSTAPAVRGSAIANAMAAAAFTDRWAALSPPERRLTGVRTIELPDSASEAQAIAIALREAVETPGRTAALVTPDRMLAARVSALLMRWGIQADDSAGKPLAQTPIGTLLLGIAAAAAERLAPIATLALVKHPLVGAADRSAWLDAARRLDLALRGPRPPGGLAGLDAHVATKETVKRVKAIGAAWVVLRPALAGVDGALSCPLTIASFAGTLRTLVSSLAGDSAWSGAEGRAAGELLDSLETATAAADPMTPDDAVPLLRQLLDGVAVRPAYGGHPRVQILGLLEARLQQADLMILSGLNEGNWPALPQPDPWLAPKIRANLGLPGLEFRIGLAAHDFASALGGARVLVTRARRDGRSPTVASRFLLRLEAMTGGLARNPQLEAWTRAIDAPDAVHPAPANRPRPMPRPDQRPRKLSVTSVDRLKADPFAFYAREILRLHALDPVDADHTAAWKGSAVHKILEQWLRDDDCDPDTLRPRAEALLRDEALHPMLRTLWQPRLLEAIDWVADQVRKDRAAGRLPLAAERWGEANIAGIALGGRIDRFDRLADGGLAVIDYKTGKAPSPKAVEGGFALQLGLLGLIAAAGGFDGISGDPRAHEYWSLAKVRDSFGKRSALDLKIGSEAFLARTEAAFRALVDDYLLGSAAFVAKLHPAFAPYGDYDQLMRLEEWYGRE